MQNSLISMSLWQYALLFVAILLSLQASKPKIISIKVLLYSPILFFVFSFFVIYFFLPLDKYNISAYLTTCVLGAMLGWIQLRDLGIKAIRNTQTIFMPGTWFVLFMFIFLIVIHQVFNSNLSHLNVKILQTSKYTFGIMSIYGFMTGRILGRIIFAYKCIYCGPYIALEEVKAIIKSHRFFKRATKQVH